MNNIFYNITSASLYWNPFIHFLHTIHIIPPPDIVTGWHILCLIYFSGTSLNQTRTDKFLMSLHQLPEGCSSILFIPTEWPPGFINNQISHDPPYHSGHSSWTFSAPLCRLFDTSRIRVTSSTPESIPLTTWQIQPLLPTQSLDKWNIIIFYIKSPSYSPPWDRNTHISSLVRKNGPPSPTARTPNSLVQLWRKRLQNTCTKDIITGLVIPKM